MICFTKTTWIDLFKVAADPTHFLVELPKLGGVLRVVRVFGGRFWFAFIPILPANTANFFRRGQMDGGGGSFFRGHACKSSELPHQAVEGYGVFQADIRLYQSGLYGIDSNRKIFSPLKLSGKKDIGQFGLGISPKAVVIAAQVDILEMDLSMEMGIRADIDNPGIG